MRISRRFGSLLCTFLCFLFGMGLARPLHAQVDRAGLNGTVTDSSGRILPVFDFSGNESEFRGSLSYRS